MPRKIVLLLNGNEPLLSEVPAIDEAELQERIKKTPELIPIESSAAGQDRLAALARASIHHPDRLALAARHARPLEHRDSDGDPGLLVQVPL